MGVGEGGDVADGVDGGVGRLHLAVHFDAGVEEGELVREEGGVGGDADADHYERGRQARGVFEDDGGYLGTRWYRFAWVRQ